MMVGKWRRRLVEKHLHDLVDEPRLGPPRTMSDDQVEAVIVKTLEEKPAGATHGSIRSMAKAMGMSQTSISLIWRAFGLQPHRAESFKLSTDPPFVNKAKDICGLYLDPPERAVVRCVDGKSQIEALNRFAPILPMMPGTRDRVSHDYVRSGTPSLFAALDMATGKVIGSTHRRHWAAEFKKFPQSIDISMSTWCWITTPPTKTPEIQRWLLRHPPSTLHFVPTAGSLLNLVERWLSELATKLRRSSAVRI